MEAEAPRNRPIHTREGTGAAANEKQKNEKEAANKSNSWQEKGRISTKTSEEVGGGKGSKGLRAGRAG